MKKLIFKPKLIFKKGNRQNTKQDKTGTKVFSEKIPFFQYAFLAVIVNLVFVGLIFLFKKFIPPEVPLMYGKPEGEEQLTPTIWLVIPLFISIGIIVINCLISYLANDIFIKKLLVLFSLLISVFSVITTLKIIFLVGSF